MSNLAFGRPGLGFEGGAHAQTVNRRNQRVGGHPKVHVLGNGATCLTVGEGLGDQSMELLIVALVDGSELRVHKRPPPIGQQDPPVPHPRFIEGQSHFRGDACIGSIEFSQISDEGLRDLFEGCQQQGILAVKVVGNRACGRPRDTGHIDKANVVEAGFTDHVDRSAGDAAPLSLMVDNFWHNHHYAKKIASVNIFKDWDFRVWISIGAGPRVTPAMSTSRPPRSATDPLPTLKAIPNAPPTEALRWLVQFRQNALALTTRMYENHGPVVTTRVPGMHFVSLFGPDAARYLLLNRNQGLSAKESWEWIMGRIFGGGLMLRDGEDHRQHRAIMQVAFKKAALEEYLERMNPEIKSGLARLEAGNSQVHAFPMFKHLTLDLAATVFLGLDLGPEVSRMNTAFEATVAASMSNLRLNIPGTEFGRGLAGRRYLEELFGKLIPGRRAGSDRDMFSLLCRAESEEGERYTDREIVDHFIFLMMAAHDTTTSTLTSMVYLLAKHPEWQDKVREECSGVGNEALTFAELGELELTERVMKESLRMFPPLSTIPRMALEDLDYQGFRIPKGALVSAYPIHTHHMAEYWSDPFCFDPDRFTEERAEHKRHSHSWLPFGGGAHMCLGMIFADLQVKAILHHLVRRYRWTLPEGYQISVQEAPISKPQDGLPLELTRL